MQYGEYLSEDPEYLWEVRIPQTEVNLATQDFSLETRLDQDNRFIYLGKLPDKRWPRTAAIKWHHVTRDQVHEFYTECGLHSKCRHENIIPFIGFCNDGDKLITVTDYASKGSLDRYLKSRYYLSWEKRLEISLGVAKGLKYLQSCLLEDMIVVIRNLMSSNILLDENMEAKICSLKHSRLVSKKEQQAYSFCSAAWTDQYLDPVYAESHLLNPESDVYSLGVILFELMSGTLAGEPKSIGDLKPQFLINLVRQYYDAGLEILKDPRISDHIDRRSFSLFKEIAYKCLSLNIKERPSIDMIIEKIEEALRIHREDVYSVNTIGSHQGKRFNISPFEMNLISKYDHRTNHGQLPERFQNRKPFVKEYTKTKSDEFHLEVDMTPNFQHENIVGVLGYYKAILPDSPLTFGLGKIIEKKIVYENAINGSLYSHLESRKKIRCITWAQRLKICLGAARGLKCLHSGIGDQGRLIHRNFSSKKILLDDNMEAKIYDFTKSVLVPRNQQRVYHPMVDPEKERVAPVKFWAYIDPVYRASGFLRTEVDIYPFGNVMFELLAGTTFYESLLQRYVEGTDRATFKLTALVRQYYHTDPFKLVDPDIINQADRQSILKYMELAYNCISFNLKDRPSMNMIVKTIEKLLKFQDKESASTSTIRSLQSEDLKIPLIIAATNEFSPGNKIGSGGFGDVYKGTLTERWQNRTAAIKRLKAEYQKGNDFFRKELEHIFNFHHENVVPFICYCDEGNEMIIVTEYAANGSLDDHLEDSNKRSRLTWEQRLKICLGAAKGLQHLHLGNGDGNKLIHRDVKSNNILLDENTEAKICDFGMSRSAPTNQATDTGLHIGIGGTEYYIDPIYRETWKLRAESDVYSFGVVLFELLTGKMAYKLLPSEDGKTDQLFIYVVRRLKGSIGDQLIDPLIKDEADDRSILAFQDIAYECISLNYKKRPTMDKIIDRIEEALEYQFRVMFHYVCDMSGPFVMLYCL
ncbi:uncharacterized protein LOC143582141 [Bidens hawaiensis]|uniref:uncharacterized protein LOC143582141 n=1 Tax=Bidens hawaiensis TaxID=980011 RepID=UPI0040496257